MVPARDGRAASQLGTDPKTLDAKDKKVIVIGGTSFRVERGQLVVTLFSRGSQRFGDFLGLQASCVVYFSRVISQTLMTLLLFQAETLEMTALELP